MTPPPSAPAAPTGGPTVWVVGVVLFALGPVALLAPHGSAVILALLAIAALVLGARGHATLRLPAQSVMTLFFLLFIWAGLSAIWMVEPGTALAGTAKQVGIFLAGCFGLALARGMTAPAASRVLAALAWGGVVMLSLFVLDVNSNYTLSNSILDRNVYVPASNPFVYKMLASIVAILVWPLMAFAFGRTHGLLYAGLIWVAAFYMIHTGNSRTALTAFGVGTVVGALVFAHRRFGAALVIGTVAVLVATLPLMFIAVSDPDAIGRMLPSSLHHRFLIWDFVVGKIADAPWIGHGMKSSPLIEGGRGILEFKYVNATGEKLPLHPHNGILQIWLELGLVGAVLAIATLVTVLRRAFAAAPGRVPAALLGAQVASAFVIANASYSVWQSWWVSALWLAAILMVMAFSAHKKTP